MSYVRKSGLDEKISKEEYKEKNAAARSQDRKTAERMQALGIPVLIVFEGSGLPERGCRSGI